MGRSYSLLAMLDDDGLEDKWEGLRRSFCGTRPVVRV